MYKAKIRFVSLKGQIDFVFRSWSEEEVNNFLFEISKYFISRIDEKNHKLHIEAHKINSVKFQSDFYEFILRYQDALPQVKGIESYLRRIGEGTSFLFLPNIEDLSQKKELELITRLRSIVENTPYKTLERENAKLFGRLLDIYQVNVFGNDRLLIGNEDRKMRKCRFCGKDSNETTFRSDAHAISEALGGKKVILLDECDNCNNKFGGGIELDTADYFTFWRSVCNIRGKGGAKVFKGKNFELENNANLEIRVTSSPEFDNNGNIVSIKLDLNRKIVLLNIYKTFVKFFLICIDESLISKFSTTISWLNGNTNIAKLPKIACLFNGHDMRSEPILSTYIRMARKGHLPYAIGVLNTMVFTYVFIIPGCSEDANDFSDDKVYARYWKSMKNFSGIVGWDFRDFSESIERGLVYNLKFTKANKKL